jgi:hypothetical protein
MVSRQVYSTVQIWRVCPEKETSIERTGFKTPLMPGWPCVAIFVNWYLIAQLELVGIGVLLLYMSLVTVFYFLYSAKHSVISKKMYGGINRSRLREGSNAEVGQLLLGEETDDTDSDDYADDIIEMQTLVHAGLGGPLGLVPTPITAATASGTDDTPVDAIATPTSAKEENGTAPPCI